MDFFFGFKNADFLTKYTHQFWEDCYSGSETLYQYLSPHCRLQNKYGEGARGCNGQLRCSEKLVEIRETLLNRNAVDCKSLVRVMSGSLTCLLVTAHNTEGSGDDWALGFVMEWECTRIVAMLFIDAVDPETFLDNVKLLKDFRALDSAATRRGRNIQWRRHSGSKNITDTVLYDDEVSEDFFDHHGLDLSMKGKEFWFKCGAAASAPIEAQHLEPAEKSTNSLDSNNINDLCSDSFSQSFSPSRRTAWAKYFHTEPKKVRFATPLRSFALIPVLKENPGKSLLFYGSMDFRMFRNDLDAEIAQQIRWHYMLTKVTLTAQEARKLVLQPQHSILYDNNSLKREAGPMISVEKEVSPVQLIDETPLTSESNAVHPRNLSMDDEIDRRAMTKRYGISMSSVGAHDALDKDSIIPQKEYQNWYISKYARLAYRKITNKKVARGGGIARTVDTSTLRLKHGYKVISVVEPAVDSIDSKALKGLKTVGRNEAGPVTAPSFLLGRHIKQPFTFDKPPERCKTKILITCIGCKNLKSPFTRLFPRPVNSFVEMKIRNKKLRTEVKHTDWNPLYDNSVRYVFDLEDDPFGEQRDYLQLTVNDSCLSTSKIGRTWIPLSSIDFSGDDSSPLLVTLPLYTSSNLSFSGVCYNMNSGVVVPPIATTEVVDRGRIKNDDLAAHVPVTESPTITILISKVNRLLHWMLEEVRIKDEDRDWSIVQENNKLRISTSCDEPGAALTANDVFVEIPIDDIDPVNVASGFPDHEMLHDSNAKKEEIMNELEPRCVLSKNPAELLTMTTSIRKKDHLDGPAMLGDNNGDCSFVDEIEANEYDDNEDECKNTEAWFF